MSCKDGEPPQKIIKYCVFLIIMPYNISDKNGQGLSKKALVSMKKKPMIRRQRFEKLIIINIWKRISCVNFIISYITAIYDRRLVYDAIYN